MEKEKRMRLKVFWGFVVLTLLLGLGLIGLMGQSQTCSNVKITNGVLSGTCVTTIVPPPSPGPTPTNPPSYANPKSVLVVINDNMGPEAGTNGMDAGLYIAQHYMQARGIPAVNLVHTQSFLEKDHSGSTCLPGCLDMNISGDGEHVTQAEFQAQILAPIMAKVTPAIHYVVMTYGTPYRINVPTGDPLSLDSVLSASLLPQSTFWVNNPYYDPSFNGSPQHIDVSTAKILLVTRLDGRTAAIAAGLVDGAIAGETAGLYGNGYFDYNPNGPLGATMLNAYNECVRLVPNPGVNCILNDQSKTGKMIQSAPLTRWAWGGYDLSASNAMGYTFAPGAIATQMNSNSANCLHRACSGDYVDLFITAGASASWGAVSEPYTQGYAMGDSLLSHFWRGYTYGESAYLSQRYVNWMMVFIGDPLYHE